MVGGRAAAAGGGRKRKDPSFPHLTAACKRRLTATTAVSSPATETAAEEDKSGWASLPTDIARLVGGRVLAGDVVGYIAFRGVCSWWRACTPSPRDPTLLDRRLRPRAYVALCDGDGVRPDANANRQIIITFLHTRTARCLRVRLPEEARHHRIVGFTDGLIILLHKRTTAVRVLHPFTLVAVDLPSLAPIFHQVVRNRNSLLDMNAAVCASAGAVKSIAVVVCFPYTPGVVLSSEPGHSGWEVIHRDMDLMNTLPFHGRLYGFRRFTRQIVQVYPPKPINPVVAHVPDKFGDPVSCSYKLVDSFGHMLLVVHYLSPRHIEAKELWQRCAFAIFEVDVNSSWKLRPVRSIGNLALFICKDRCLSVSAKDLPSISRNSVYHCVTAKSCRFILSKRPIVRAANKIVPSP
uniref:KIB1-4 beta-propeller domain-containing protein n=1 Tax=Leersia perrieri TaxID=77586 RepID=A0A0D9XDL1_9ORYZ